MSIGVGAYGKLILQDDATVIYEYGCYNLNEEEFANRMRVRDGLILIQKDCFQEPEIHEKLKKMPNGRKKLMIKRIPVNVNYEKMIAEGSIIIENSLNCWKTTDTEMCIDVMALRLLHKLFGVYQEESKIPECISFHV